VGVAGGGPQDPLVGEAATAAVADVLDHGREPPATTGREVDQARIGEPP
jgi:hypothetical protein